MQERKSLFRNKTFFFQGLWRLTKDLAGRFKLNASNCTIENFAKTPAATSMASLARWCGATVLQKCPFRLERFLLTREWLAHAICSHSGGCFLLISRDESSFVFTSTKNKDEIILICNQKNRRRRLVARSHRTTSLSPLARTHKNDDLVCRCNHLIFCFMHIIYLTANRRRVGQRGIQRSNSSAVELDFWLYQLLQVARLHKILIWSVVFISQSCRFVKYQFVWERIFSKIQLNIMEV